MHKPSLKSILAKTTEIIPWRRRTDRQTAFQLYIVDKIFIHIIYRHFIIHVTLQ